MNRLPILLAAALVYVQGMAQQPESKIALTPYVEYSMDRVPETASRSLERKLVSMTTANGFASVAGDFIITAVPDVLDVSVTPTAPPQYAADVEVAVYVLNNTEKIIVDQKVYALKGIGTSEQKAVAGAINQIDVRSVDTRRFMENVRTKMLDYYALRLPSLIAKAQSLASMTRYEEALAVLAAVPESIDEYPQVAELMVDIYTDCIDRNARKIIAEAEIKVAQDDYIQALKELVKVDPNSSLSGEADALVSKISGKIEADKQAEIQRELERYEQQKKEYADRVDIEKQKIEASRSIASAVAGTGAGADAGNAVNAAGKSIAEWFFGNLL